jgi:hypothetical protein
MMRSMHRLIVPLLCLVLVQCGGQSPVSSTPVSPAAAEPPAAIPPSVSPPAEPSPGPPGGLAEVFVGAGDIATCDQNSEDTARLLDAIPGTVFTLGDHAYPRGAEAEFRACYEPTWGRHKARTRPTPGNHEYETPGATTYFTYFGAAAGPPGLGYYSYDLGSWHVVSLNSNTNIPAQVIWLQADLEAHRNRCTLAYWHHSLYSSGPERMTPGVRDLWRVLYRSGADVVLSSHNHLYERFAPQDHEGQMDPVRGLRQFVVGTGGAPLHSRQETMPHSELLIAAFGVLKMTLGSGTYDWEFVSVSGSLDRGTASCH